MSQEHLIPFNVMDKEKARQIQSMGGSTVSQQKKYAARLRELKKKGLTDETVERLMDIIEDSDCSALDIKLFIESIRTQELATDEKIRLANLMVAWHRAHHGEKHGIVSINVDTRIREDLEKWFTNEENKQI